MRSVPTFRVLRRLTSIELASAFMYRTQFFIDMLSTAVNILIGLLIWLRLEQSGADLPVDRDFIISYYLMLAIVRVFTSAWQSEALAGVIRSGQLNGWLIRPGSYLVNQIANNLAEKVVKLAAIALMLAPVWVAYRQAFVLPTNLGRWLLFLSTLILAAAMQFCLSSIIGALGFWMDDNSGVERGRYVISMVLSGEAVPLALFPAWALSFLNWQPFRFTISFPLEVLLGSVTGADLVYGFGMQIAWTILFGWLTWFTWQRGLRSYSAVGA